MIAPTPFFADRGCHVRILEEVQAVRALGYRVIICTYHVGRDIGGIKIRRIVRIPWYSKLSAGPSIHKFYLDFLLLLTAIRACIQDKPDMIHAHLHEGIVVGKIASLIFRLPLIADIQGSLTDELLQHHFIKEKGLICLFFQWLEDIIIQMPDFILTSFTKNLSRNPKVISGIKGKTEIIIDGVDTNRFYPGYPSDGLSDRLSIPKKTKVVGFLGVLTDYQGVSVLLEAISHLVKRMKHVHFLIMGYPSVEYYRGKAKHFGINDYVTFTGKVAYEEAPRYLAICDVVVSPKLSMTEANGKLLNYMAMGIPIVASDTPVNRAILEDLGIYSKVGDAKTFADAMHMVLTNEGYASELGVRLGKKAIDEHSWKRIGERIAEIYQRLTSKEIQPQIRNLDELE